MVVDSVQCDLEIMFSFVLHVTMCSFGPLHVMKISSYFKKYKIDCISRICVQQLFPLCISSVGPLTHQQT